MRHFLIDILWANAGVGNFTATAVLGGYVFIKHVKPALNKIHALHAHHLENNSDVHE